MNVAIVGYGYWGNHLVRNFNNSENWNVKYVCDLDNSQLAKVNKLYPNISTTNDFNIILNDKSIDAVVIATPVHTHFYLAKQALQDGKHVWIEKPMTASAIESEELIEIAKSKSLILHVDHTFIYTPAVRKIKEMITKYELGDIHYFDTVRVNRGLFQHDVNVIWDLAPHDISILNFLTNKKVISVRADGMSFHNYNDKKIESIAYLTVELENNSIAHFHVNWMSPVKIRQIIIGGSKKMLVFDDNEPMAKLKIYDSGVSIQSRDDIYNALIQYRTGDMYSPAIANYEALAAECKHFYECIKQGKDTDTSGESGLYVVRILESANESLNNGGKPIYL